MLSAVPLAGSGRYQQIGNDLTPDWTVYQFGAFTHPVSQLDHACSWFGLCRPDAFGRPLGIRKIMAVGAAMQARSQAAVGIANQFSEFQPGLLEVWLTASNYFPFKINRVHNVLSGCSRLRIDCNGRFRPEADYAIQSTTGTKACVRVSLTNDAPAGAPRRSIKESSFESTNPMETKAIFSELSM